MSDPSGRTHPYKKKRAAWMPRKPHKPSRAQFRGHLEPGMKGFLCTCNNREKECVKEALNLLSEYADKMFGKEDWRATVSESGEGSQEKPAAEETKKQEDSEDEDEEEDIADALKKEVKLIKSTNQRFRTVNSGAKNFIFISSSVPDPVSLVHQLLTDLKTSKSPRSRFLLRLLPVEVTCKAQLDDITAAASKLFNTYFSEGNKTFSIIYKCRNNSGVSRDALIEALAEIVILKNASNHADLSNPQLAVLVEIVRTTCCMSVVSDYFSLSKYNVLEVAQPVQAPKVDTDTGSD